MATDRELLVDALVRVQIALDHPDLSDNERAALEMIYIRRWSEDDSRGTLCMTQREFRKTKSEALDKACVMPKPVKKAGPEQMEAE
jgi:hypothetical protein